MENRPDFAFLPLRPQKSPRRERRGLWFQKSALLEEPVVRAALEMFGGKVVKEWPNAQK